jgi:hypothetical protein
MQGVVISLPEARLLWEKVGGEPPPLKAIPEMVFVVLPLFGRSVPFSLLRFQVEALEDE